MNLAEKPRPPDVPPAAYGCGDYPAYIEHEAWESRRETDWAAEDRFFPETNAETAHLYEVEVERYWVQQEISLLGKSLDEWNAEVDRVLFARRLSWFARSRAKILSLFSMLGDD